MKWRALMVGLHRLARRHMRNVRRAQTDAARKERRLASERGFIAAVLLLAEPLAHAAPTGGQVVSGVGTITQSGLITTIHQTSTNLSLDWKTFDIAPQQTVDFLQPSALAIAINRIFDTNGTQIFGHLNANGQVYLINPNGILFGKGAVVNIGGLVAATLNLSDLTLSGDSRSFSGASSASVVNDGVINAANGGYVALVGDRVSNQGLISAQMGTVALAAGSAATLTFSGDSLLRMKVDQSVLNSVAENGGLLRADGGQVLMTAGAKKALLASVVNNTGFIQARTMENRDGSIVLLGGMQVGEVSVDGTVDASSTSGHGGAVVATAADVIVGAGAKVDASGTTGGGTINIGGGWQGGGGIDQATTVSVAKTATLDASATAIGNGGEISVRSDVNDPQSVTRVAGTLLARGGKGGGNGGDIETSGHWLDVAGSTADASARLGRPGVWLLDPYNVIIGSTTSGSTYTPPNFSPGADSTILASTISTALNGGSSVVITTGTAGSSIGDITVNTAIAKTSGATVTLTLQAADSVIVNQPITNTSTTGQLNVNLWADNDVGTHNGVGIVILDNSISTGGGAIEFGTGSTLTINSQVVLVGGDVYVGGTSPVTLATAGGNIDVHGQMIIANTGGLSVNTANGYVNFDGLVDAGDSYTFVPSTGITWTAALAAAQSGIGANVGDTYLATITSRLENAVAASTASYVASWLGAERVTNESTDTIWRWVTGPEGLENAGKGLEFFTQNGSDTVNGSGGTAIGSAYLNWNSGEPNNSGGANLSKTGSVEYVMQFVGTQGEWNNLAPSTLLLGYLKETNLAPSALSVNAGTGVVTFAAALGSNKPLASLSVTAQTIALPSPPTLNTTGAQTYVGQVTVGGQDVNLLTVSANNLNTTYGLGVPALSATYSGFVNGNTVASLTTPASLSTTASAQPNVGSYPITAAGVVDPNYFVVYNPGALIVNPATLTITANNASKTYFSANPTLSAAYTGFQYSDSVTSVITAPVITSTATQPSNVGQYNITASGAVLSNNYTAAYVGGLLTVNPVVMTVTGPATAGTSRTYNGSTVDMAAGGAASLCCIVGTNEMTLGGLGDDTLASANAGSEAVTSNLFLVAISGLASNYSLTQPTLANVTIAPAPLTVTGLAGTSRIYNATTVDAVTGTPSLRGLISGQALTLGGAASGTLASANAGSEAVTTALTLANGTGGLASNYLLTQPTLANVTIAQAPLTVSGFSSTGRTYNGTTVDALTGTGSLTGLIAGQTLTLGNAASGSLASANAGSEAVSTAITLVSGTGLAGNYVLTQPTLANVAIAQAPLTESGLSGTSRTYDGTTVDALTGTGSLTGLFGGQALTLGNAADGALASANAGSEAVSTALTLVNGTGLARNYILTQPTLANVTIAQAPLTVSAPGVNNKVYDGTTAAVLTGTLSGVIGADVVNLIPAGTFASKNVGTGVVVTATDTLTGAAAPNYSLTEPTGLTANITPLAITVSASGVNRVYDGTVNDAAILASSGVIAGDTVDFTDTAAVFADKNVGNAKPVTVSGISLFGADAGNYSLSSTTASTSANITQLGSVTWVGPATGGSWSNPANWAGGAIPDLANVANVVIPTGDSVRFDSSVAGPVTINQLSSGGLIVDSGDLNVASALILANYSQSGGTLGGTGSFTVSNSFTQTAGQIAMTGGAVNITQQAGDLSVANIAGGAVSLRSAAGAVVLGNVSASGAFSAIAQGGTVTQSMDTALAVNGPTTLAASNNGAPADINLPNSGNTFGEAVSASGADVTLAAAGPLALGTVAASGDLTLNSTGALDLGTASVGGNLAANSANGDVTQDGPLAVTGTTAIAAGSGNIELTNAANTFAQAVSGTGADISLTTAGPLSLGTVAASADLTLASTGALDLGTSSVGGNLAANSTNGDVTQDGPLAVDGTTDIAAGTGNIQLTNAANTFAQAVSGSGAGISLTAAGALSLGTVAASGDLTLASSGALDLGTSSVGGNLAANSTNGNITQDGPLAVTGTTAIEAGSGNIELANAANTFAQAVSGSGAEISLTAAGPLSLGVVGASGNLTLASTGALDLGISTVGGNLAANSSNGDVTQDGPLAVAGTTDITAGSGNIELTNAANTFAQAVSTSGAGIGLSDAGPLTLGTVAAGGNLTLASTGALDLGTSSVGGDLAANSTNGNVTQNGPLAVSGTTDIAAGTGNIQLTNAANTFAQAVSASGAGIALTAAGPLTLGTVAASGDLTLAASGALDLGTSSVGGNLAANSTNGDVTQDGPLAVDGTTNIAAGTGNIQLTNAANTFAQAVNASGAGISLTDAGPLTLGTVAASGNLTLASTGALDLGTSSVGGDLAANSTNGNVTQHGPLAVTGTTAIEAGSGNIELANAANTFAQAVSASGAGIALTAAGPLTLGTVAASGDLTLAASGALDLGTSSVGGNLAANSMNGNVTQDGPLAITGTTDITAGSGNIELTNAANTFAQAVNASGAGISLTDAGPLTLGTVAASGNLTLASTGALDLGTSSVGGDLAANSTNGDVTQNGPLAVSGTTDIAAGTGNIQLTNAANTFDQAVSGSGAGISLTAAGALSLGTVAASGNLTLASTGALNLGTSSIGGNLAAHSTNGNVSQDGPLAVTGTTDITAGSGNIELTNAANTFAQAVNASGARISLTDAGPLTLGTVAASGSLTLTATGALDMGTSSVGGDLAANSTNGNVTQDGPLAISGTTDVAAGTGNIQLTNAANTFAQAVSGSGAGISLTAAGALSLGTVAARGNLTLASIGAMNLGTSSVGGNLAANSTDGNVSQDGPLAVTGTTGIVAGSGNIQLTNAANTFAGAVSSSGAQISLTAAGPLTLGTVGARGNLTLAAVGPMDLGTSSVGGNLAANSTDGNITQDTRLTVAGTTNIAAGTGDIQLTNAANIFAGAVSSSGAQISLTAAGPLTLGTVAASGDLTLAATGALDLGTSSAGENLLASSANGNVTQNGPLSVHGTTDIAAGKGNIQLTNAANTLVGAVTASGKQVSLKDSVPMILGTSEASGNLTVGSEGALDLGTATVGGSLVATSDNGNVTQNGPLRVAGTTSIAAGTGTIQLGNAGNVFTGGTTASGNGITVVGKGPDLPINTVTVSTVETEGPNVVSQLESSLLAANSGIPLEMLSLSSTDDSGADAASTAGSGSGDGKLLDVSVNIGARGPPLHILKGGMRLPDNRVNASQIQN